MTLFPGNDSSELDPAARWLAHYEEVARQQRALGPLRRHPRPRLPATQRRRRTISTFIALSVVFVGAALALLWLPKP